MRRAVLAVVVVLGVAASGCTIGERAASTAARTPAPGATTGGVLRIGITEPASIDPSLATIRDPSGFLVVSAICDPLVSFDPVTGEPRPAVAHRFQSTDAGRTITAALRRGVELHDGSAAGAEDVTFALSRAAHPDTVSPSADLLREVAGWEVLREDRVEGDQLPGARVVSPLDLELIVPLQRGGLMRVLGHPVAAPLPRDVLGPLGGSSDDGSFGTRPVCSGPYRVADPYLPGDEEIRLERFDAYHAQNAAYTAGGAGWADEIVFRIYPDLPAQLDAFRAGEIDVAHVPEAHVQDAMALGEVVSTPSERLDYVGLPTSSAPFDDRRVRVAFSQALDRRAIVDTVYGGVRTPAAGYLPPTLGDDLYRPDACGVNAPVGGDVDAARATLGDAADALEGTTVPFYFNDEHGHRALVQEIARQWTEAFGVRFELRPMGWEAYLAASTSTSGFDGPFRFSWGAEYPDPHAYLEPLFHSSAAGATNLSRFGDDRLDRMIERDARRAITLADQAVAYEQVEDAACAAMPVVPVSFGARHHVFRSDTVGSASGVVVDRTTALPALRELYVR